jgi:hypothetical protein
MKASVEVERGKKTVPTPLVDEVTFSSVIM